jgi:hypothetical protein
VQAGHTAVGDSRMTRSRRSIRGAAAALAAIAVGVGALGGATPASAAPATLPPTPVLDVTVAATHVQLSGSWDARPGLLTIRLHAVGNEQEIVLVRLRPGYSLPRYEADERLAEGQGDLAALARARANRVALGSVDTQPGRPESMTVGLGAGTYYLYSASYGVVDPHRLVVGGPVRLTQPTLPTSVVEERDNGVATPTVLPRRGSILLVDRGRQEHLLCLDGVKPGTTAAEVRAYLADPGDAAPTFAIPVLGCAGALTADGAQLWTYSRPPGEYALFDPTPDARADGAPYATSGVLRIVQVH